MLINSDQIEGGESTEARSSPTFFLFVTQLYIFIEMGNATN